MKLFMVTTPLDCNLMFPHWDIFNCALDYFILEGVASSEQSVIRLAQ